MHLNGDNNINQLKNLFYEGCNSYKNFKADDLLKNKTNKFNKNFSNVNFRGYDRDLHVNNPADVLGYYLSNKNPKVREWALEDSDWILKKSSEIIKSYGYFKVDISFGMFVCTM